MRFVLVAVLVLGLVGCGAPLIFDKPGVAPGDGQGDLVDCQVEALHDVPPNNQTRTISGGPAYTSLNCTGASCTATTYGGSNNSYTVDANAGLRQQVMIQCMERKGYTLRR